MREKREKEQKKKKNRVKNQIQLAVFSEKIPPFFSSPFLFFFSAFMSVMLKWMMTFGENSLLETFSKTGEEENESK